MHWIGLDDNIVNRSREDDTLLLVQSYLNPHIPRTNLKRRHHIIGSVTLPP